MELDTPEIELDGWAVLAASGEIDVAAAPDLRARLTELIESGSTRIVLDLDDVDFIDSTGLGVLVGAIRRARAAEGDLRLVCTNSRLLKVLDVTGLDDVFPVRDSVEEAVRGGEAPAVGGDDA